jgi:anti-sigma factor RsiW
MICNDVRQHWMLYLDSEGDPELHFRISDHLGMCPECAEWFAKQERFERLATEHLRCDAADDELWSRVLRGTGLVQGRLVGRRRWLVWGRAGVLGAIGLAAAVMLLVVFRPANNSAAANDLARLAVDCHERHLRGLSNIEFLSQDDRAVADYLRQHVSFPIHQPPPKEKGFTVEGAGVCRWAPKPMAYITGRVQQTSASIFVLARDSLDTFPRTRDCLLADGGHYRCREQNYQTVSAITPDNVVMVVGTAPPDALEQLLNTYVSSSRELR